MNGGLMSNLRMEQFKSNLYSGVYIGKSGVQLQNSATCKQKLNNGLNNCFYSSNKRRFEASPLLSGIIPIIQNSGTQITGGVSKSIGRDLLNPMSPMKKWVRLQALPSHFIGILDNLRITCFSTKAKWIEIALRSPTFKAIYERANATSPYSEESKSGIWTIEVVPPELSPFGAACDHVSRKIKISSKASEAEFLSWLLFELTNSIQTPIRKEIDQKMLAGSSNCEEYARAIEFFEFRGTLYHAYVMPKIVTEIYGIDNELNEETLRQLNRYRSSLEAIKNIQKQYPDAISDQQIEELAFQQDWAHRLNNGENRHTENYRNGYISFREHVKKWSQRVKEWNQNNERYNQEVREYNQATEGRGPKAIPLVPLSKISIKHYKEEDHNEEIKEYNQKISQYNRTVKEYNHQLEQSLKKNEQENASLNHSNETSSAIKESSVKEHNHQVEHLKKNEQEKASLNHSNDASAASKEPINLSLEFI